MHWQSTSVSRYLDTCFLKSHCQTRVCPGKHTGVGCHFLLQGILLTQGSNPHLLCLLHCRWNLYPLNHQGSYTHTHILFQILFYYRLLEDNESSSLCYKVGPCWLSIDILYTVVCFCLEKVMAPHSSTLAWKIPWTEEPGRLQSMGSRRIRHN